HIFLNQHLHHIGKSNTPNCFHCDNTSKTVCYYLLDCPQYVHKQSRLKADL
ncbi:hypothetical protein F5I97DRAFT_1788665, partial [Phlebopus sp. FC_14]